MKTDVNADKTKREKTKREKGEGINKRFERRLSISFIARFLLFIGGLEERMKNGLFSRGIRRTKDNPRKGRGILRRVKRTVASEIEQSLIFHSINLFFDLLLRLPMRAYGTLLFASSVGTAVVSALKNYIAGGDLFAYNSMFYYAAVAAASVFLIASSKTKSLGDAMLDSRIFSFLLFDLLGIRKRSFETKNTAEVNYPIILATALVFSLLTIVFEPLTLIFAILWVLFARLAFYSPESGFLTVLLFLPLLPDLEPLIMVVLVALSYFIKVFRSQRTFRVSFFGIFMLMYAFLLLFGTLMTRASGGGLGFALCFPAAAAFFLGHLLFDRREWVLRAASVVVFSAVLSGAWVALQFGAQKLIEYKGTYGMMFPLITNYKWPAGMSGVESAGVYIAAAIALLTARYLKNKKIVFRIAAVLGGLILSAGAILSQRPAAWFALLAALVILLILNKNFAAIPSLLIIGAAVIVYVLILPKGITDYISSANPNGFSHGFSADFGIIGSQLGESAMRFFAGIGEAGVKYGENFYSHILTSQGAIGLIFFLFCVIGSFGYAYHTCVKNGNCSKHIKQVVFGAVSAACALLIAGVFMDLWADPKLPFLLFSILGLILAGGRVLLRESEQLTISSDLDRDYYFIPVVHEEKKEKPRKVKEKKAAIITGAPIQTGEEQPPPDAAPEGPADAPYDAREEAVDAGGTPDDSPLNNGRGDEG